MKTMQRSLLAIAILAVTISQAHGQRCSDGVSCIALEECTGLYTQLQKSDKTAQLARFLRSLHCGFQGEDPMVCCPREYLYGPIDVGEGGGNSGAERAGGEGYTGNAVSLLPNLRECGIQIIDKIVGGTQAAIDEHPWMVLLRYDKPYGSGYYCGGVLISSRYVLTAAHCVKGEDLPTNWRVSQVRLGEWNTSSSVDCLLDDCARPVQDIPIEEIIAHEGYVPSDSNQHNDIALIRLSKNAVFYDTVKPICLPLTDQLKQGSFDGYVMQVSGWGKTESRSESDVKLTVRVPVVNLNKCAKKYSTVGRQIIDKQICAGGKAGKDSCRGDSGGALMGRIPGIENWFAIGVVSYGPTPCGTPGWPGVYTRVGAYVDWILSKLRP